MPEASACSVSPRSGILLPHHRMVDGLALLDELHVERDQPDPPPDRMVATLDVGPVIRREEDLERPVELEEILAHPPGLDPPVAGDPLHQGLGQPLPVVRLAGDHVAAVMQVRDSRRMTVGPGLQE